MASHSDEYGPTWTDVYDYVNRLQLVWNVVIYLQMRLHMSGKPERLTGQCSALARDPLFPLGPDLKVGTHGFKGNAGAKSASGAYWLALSDLEGRLAGLDRVAQQRLDL